MSRIQTKRHASDVKISFQTLRNHAVRSREIVVQFRILHLQNLFFQVWRSKHILQVEHDSKLLAKFGKSCSERNVRAFFIEWVRLMKDTRHVRTRTTIMDRECNVMIERRFLDKWRFAAAQGTLAYYNTVGPLPYSYVFSHEGPGHGELP